MKKGVLLINLGTPDSPEVKDVRRYLTEFLNDPRVIDINPIARFFLVNFIIIPARARNSARLYKEIWDDRGSPLLYHSEDLKKKLQEKMPDVHVALAMRYGRPSIQDGLNELAGNGVRFLKVVPLYPQYASSSTATALDKVHRVLNKKHIGIKSVQSLSPFFNDPGYIASFIENARKFDLSSYDHFLFSYHGLPERHIYKSAKELGLKTCRISTCCDRIHDGNEWCYRASCFETSRLIAKELGIPTSRYTNAFQSRLDDKWLKPYSDKVVAELARDGKTKVLVFSPAFVADCLETIYEIGTEYREIFHENGGSQLDLVPSLNSNDSWVNALERMITRT